MSLTVVKKRDVIKKLTLFKFKSYTKVYSSLVITQLIALFFASFGTAQFGVQMFNTSLDVSYHTVDVVIIFTMIWGLVQGIQILTVPYREDDYVFVTNGFTQHMANILFLIGISIFSGITCFFARYVQRVVMYFIYGQENYYDATSSMDLWMLITGLLATILFIFLFCMIGYGIGGFVQFHKIFIIVIPAFVIGFMYASVLIGVTWPVDVFVFYGSEPSFILFVGKVILTSLVLFGLAYLTTRRLEVRK